MEDWQREIISSKLWELIQNTTCNIQLTRHLRNEKILSDGDMNQLVRNCLFVTNFGFKCHKLQVSVHIYCYYLLYTLTNIWRLCLFTAQFISALIVVLLGCYSEHITRNNNLVCLYSG